MKKEKSEYKLTEAYDPFDKKPYTNLLTTVATILLVSFGIIMINQAAQLINLAMNISPVFGKVLLVFFLILALAAGIVTISLLTRLEKPLKIPDQSNVEEYSRYLARLKQRLMKNKYLKKKGYVWDETKSDLDSIHEALKLLDEESQHIIKNHGSAVFVTTAVSQNGSLDSIFVFVTVIKLVWRISMLYNQRPAIRDLTKLYSNVFATVLLARQIDDLDLMAEQLEPILSTLFGGTVGTIVPGISYVGSFVVDSILEGGLNTLLTLRVGIITQQYCRSITRVEPRVLGKTATIQACGMLGNIVLENSKRISDALLRAIRNAAVDPFIKGKNKFAGIVDRIFRKDHTASENIQNKESFDYMNEAAAAEE